MNSTCLIITAAGRCRRMGAFKPLLPIEKKPAILHMLDNYFDAGVSNAVIVTGYQSELLMETCSCYKNITFTHNPGYLSNEMYDSIRIGLSAVPKENTSVLFTPVDTPFVSTETIRKVIQAEGELVFPSFDLHKGHPLKISRKYIPSLLLHDGSNGLRGALAALSLKPEFIEVNDPFILTDMDTPEAYEKLLQQYREVQIINEV